MIIENLEQATQAVLEETRRTPDPRAKEIIQALVRHLHAFIRETKLTEKEFDQAINYVVALGQLTTESHNEVRLMAGSLGVSTLICLMNNGPNAATESSANLLGPFWRAESPHTENGGSLLRSIFGAGCARPTANPSRVPRWTSGTLHPSASTKTRTRSRRR